MMILMSVLCRMISFANLLHSHCLRYVYITCIDISFKLEYLNAPILYYIYIGDDYVPIIIIFELILFVFYALY